MTKLYFYPQRLMTGALLTLTIGCADTAFVQDELANASKTGVTKTVTASETVATSNKQVDFLLVLDDSNSMLPELQKLSSRLATFVSGLEASQIDWQMCVTTTRNGSHGTYLNWNRYSPPRGTPAFVLARGTSNLSSVFTSTIDAVTIGGGDSSDERAVKAAFVSFRDGGPCYRPGAAVSVIAISDEDERSVGGDPSRVKANDAAGIYIPLEFEDMPVNLVARAQSSFGADVRFTFNSIIVKPGDRSCEARQDEHTSPSHPGYIYSEISTLTGGGVGSICDADYSENLNSFKNRIVNSLGQMALQCEPVKGTLKVWVNKRLVKNYKSEKNILRFDTELGEGTQVDLVYDCQE